jgi:hypothetical protein
MSRYECKPTTIIKGNNIVTILLTEKTGLFTNRYYTHTHDVAECHPKIKRADALLYFTINKSSYFGSIPILDWVDVHTHKGIYYINKLDGLIYDYEDDKMYSKIVRNKTHTHGIKATITKIEPDDKIETQEKKTNKKNGRK